MTKLSEEAEPHPEGAGPLTLTHPAQDTSGFVVHVITTTHMDERWAESLTYWSGVQATQVPPPFSLPHKHTHTHLRYRCNFISSLLQSVDLVWSLLNIKVSDRSDYHWDQFLFQMTSCTPHSLLQPDVYQHTLLLPPSLSPSLHTYFPCLFLAHWDFNQSPWHSPSVSQRPWFLPFGPDLT